MKLGLQLGYWMGPTPPTNHLELARAAESLGYDSLWFGEAYGSDVFSPLCWIGSHTQKLKLGTSVMQLSARTPTCAAMTAATIDHLSGGRFILGVGVSGPQVVEGWYGQPFPQPMARTREYIRIMRDAWRREAPVTSPGPHYPLPYPGGAKLGKPLKLIIHPLRREIPIYLGAEGPKNVAMAFELCDGWLPLFISPFRLEIFAAALAQRKPGFEIAATVMVNVNDDLEQALLPVKMMLGFYLGGMGAKSRNFHVNLLNRMGFEAVTPKIQELFFAGRREEAVRAIPDEMADEISLCGSKERIRERLAVWKKSPVTTIMYGGGDLETMRFLAEACL